MTRLEEYEDVTKQIIETLNSGDGTFEERQTTIQSAILLDIAKSLAIIADALTEGKGVADEQANNT